MGTNPEQDGGIWIGSVVIECARWEEMVRFRTDALRYVPRDPPDEEGVVLRDPGGRGPNLSLFRSNEPPLREYRLHLDLYSSRPEDEVARLVRLGATLLRPAGVSEDFVTLADPDGNVFDVIDQRGASFGERAGPS